MKFKKIFYLIIVLIMISCVLSGCVEKEEPESVKIQDFETDFVWWAENYQGYTIYDFDYEVYDSEKYGNSKANVTGGRYSLHKKGNSEYFENCVVFNEFNKLTPNDTYTLTMNVKLGKHFHTDGAIKIYSNDSTTYPWAVSGDYISVISIKDLKKDKWTKVSFTFEPTKAFLGIHTPGYVELFIDDIKLKNVEGKEIPLSSQPEFKDYTIAKRDENGKIIVTEEGFVDVTKIIDPQLNEDNNIFKIIVAILICVIIVCVILIVFIKFRKLKHKERKDGK